MGKIKYRAETVNSFLCCFITALFSPSQSDARQQREQTAMGIGN